MIKGTLAGLVALVACPCHLPLTIPVLLLLTSGSATGLWLGANQWFIWLASVTIFAGGLGLAFLWMGRAGSQTQCELPQKNRLPTANHRAGSSGQEQSAVSKQHETEVSHV